MPQLVFKSIPGFSNYFISSEGVVITTNYPHPKILTPAISNNTGYGKTTLVNYKGETRQIDIHRLVARTWLESWDSGLCVNHIDGNKLNNSVTNLEMTTYKENAAHAQRLGLNSKHGNAKLTPEKVINLRYLYIGGYENLDNLAKKFGISRGHAHAVAVGKKWKHITDNI